MPKSAKPKLPAGITEEFVENVDRSSPDQLKAMVVTMQGQIGEVQAFLTNDEPNLPQEQLLGAQRLAEMKAAFDEAVAPSKETMRNLRARTKWVVEALKKAGAL